MEAVYDEAKLSYHALIGTRKQSVSDCGTNKFSFRVQIVFEMKGCTIEAEYVRVMEGM